MKLLRIAVLILAACPVVLLAQREGHDHGSSVPEEDLGHVHMQTSCSDRVTVDFDRALALLHNFWYNRALQRFNHVAKNDPKCAMAYWGAAMTYNHPFWDPPSQLDETTAWALVQKGLAQQNVSPREKLYLVALADLYKDAGAGNKSS